MTSSLVGSEMCIRDRCMQDLNDICSSSQTGARIWGHAQGYVVGGQMQTLVSQKVQELLRRGHLSFQTWQDSQAAILDEANKIGVGKALASKRDIAA
eukprot:4806166-Prorocentrum_lima.AAC.1